jgi:hypothetical protein
MKLFSVLLVLALSALMTGCPTFWRKPPPPPPAPSPFAKYERQDIEALMLYGGEVVQMSGGVRQSECETVKGLEKEKPSLAFRLHLFAVLSLSESCGGLSDALELLKSLQSEVKDAAVASWLRYQEELLRMVESDREARRSMEDKMKQVRATAKRSEREVKTKESEVKTLQNKLEALKSIEHNLGGSQGEH